MFMTGADPRPSWEFILGGQGDAKSKRPSNRSLERRRRWARLLFSGDAALPLNLPPWSKEGAEGELTQQRPPWTLDGCGWRNRVGGCVCVCGGEGESAVIRRSR